MRASISGHQRSERHEHFQEIPRDELATVGRRRAAFPARLADGPSGVRRLRLAMANVPGRSNKERVRSRKAPSQDRSRDTVAVIRTAAKQILEEKGFDGLTTNLIAEVAGVSIGSLYQYFPSKEAIVGAVIEQRANETIRALWEFAQNLPDNSFEGAITAVTRWYVERYRTDRALYRAILPEIERLERTEFVRERTAKIGEMIALGIGGFGDEIAPSDPELAGFLIAAAAEGVLARAVLAGDDVLDRPELADELAAMVIGYLTRRRTG